MQTTYSLAQAQKDFYQILEQVTANHQPVTIQQPDDALNAVIISKQDFQALQTTVYLAGQGVLAKVKAREQNNDGFTDVDDIDWDNLWSGSKRMSVELKQLRSQLSPRLPNM